MTAATSKTSVVIVTHNSEKFIPHLIDSLERQTFAPHEIIFVDNCSADSSYLDPLERKPRVKVIRSEENIGFCRSNNLAMSHLSPESEYVFFLNPDAFLFRDFIEQATAFMDDPANQKVGAVTGTTYGYSIDKKQPTGCYDSTGIYQTWYGKWYDRAQGKNVDPKLFQAPEEIPAICGAVFFCRKKALIEVIKKGTEVFDNNFYMYKEDIDLSLRLRKKGWKLLFVPFLYCYHCRGWNPDRRAMPKKLRLCSARNELKVHIRNPSPIPALYSLTKYLAVQLFDR